MFQWVLSLLYKNKVSGNCPFDVKYIEKEGCYEGRCPHCYRKTKFCYKPNKGIRTEKCIHCEIKMNVRPWTKF